MFSIFAFGNVVDPAEFQSENDNDTPESTVDVHDLYLSTRDLANIRPCKACGRDTLDATGLCYPCKTTVVARQSLWVARAIDNDLPVMSGIQSADAYWPRAR